MVIKRHSYKNNIIKNKRKSKINGGRPPVEDNEQCREITTLTHDDDYIKSVAFHPTLSLLATGYFNRTAKLWSFEPGGSTAICVANLSGHLGWVTSVAFHPTAPLLATGSYDDTAKLWSFSPNGSEAACVATLYGHTHWVTSVEFHPTLPLLATGSTDQTAKLWRFNLRGLAEHDMPWNCVATTVKHNEYIASPRFHYEYAISVAFHPTAPLLATCSRETVRLWRFDLNDLPDDNILRNCVVTLVEHTHSIRALAFHPKLPLLATGSMDRTVRLWRVDPGHLIDDQILVPCVATIPHEGQVYAVAFHPKFPLLATSCGDLDDTHVKLWRFDPDGSTPTCMATIRGQIDVIFSVAFQPTMPLLAIASSDMTIKLWRCKSLEHPYNDFILYSKKTNADITICNRLCYSCNFNLCIKNPGNDNNINGYVVKLTNGNSANDIHFHYSCLHRYLINSNTEIDNIPISAETITGILNIDGKVDALIGTDFYNSAYKDEEGDVFWSAKSNRDDGDDGDDGDVFYSAKS